MSTVNYEKRIAAGSRMVILIVLAASLSFAASGCVASVSGGTPDWVDSLYNRQYDERTYLCAVGSGPTREYAVSAAFSNLSQVFDVRVQSIVSYVSTSTAVDDGAAEARFTDSDSLIDQGSLSTETEKIVGGEVVNTWVDGNGIVWVRVAVHRELAAELHRREMAALESDIARIRLSAAASATPIERFFALLAARQPARRHQELADQIGVLTGSLPPGMMADIQRELDSLASGITVAVDVRVSDVERILEDEQIAAARNRIAGAFASLMDGYGFTIVDTYGTKTPVLSVDYAVTPVVQPGGPYSSARYELSVRLRQNDAVLVSYQTSRRETAMSEGEAVQKALRSALLTALPEFAARMEGDLGTL